MKVLLTGATGLIGKEVGKKLALAGHDIVAVSRNPSRARLELPFPAEVYSWAGDEAEFPNSALDGVDAVIHLAGEPIAEGRWTDERKARIRNSRVLGTRRIVQAIMSHPEASDRLKVFVLGSAIGIYGDRADEPLNEASQIGQGFLADVVRDWEAEADVLIREGGGPRRVVKVRTGVVLSRHGGALGKMLPLFTRGLGGRVGLGQQWMSWIHIEDITRLFLFCLEKENAEGIFNGVAPEPAKNERFGVALARAVGRPVFLPAPETALKLALGEMSSVLFESQRVQPHRALDLGFTFRFPELISALNDLGEPLREGQRELVSEQWVPRAPKEIFPFFCDEKNLEVLTPPFLGFRVLGKSTPTIRKGTLIDYRLSLHGLPFSWQTRIEEWNPEHSFVDTQLKGPYRKWHHTHEFTPLAEGTLLRDRVLYRLPFGWLGDIAAGWKVSRDVSTIFSYRRAKVDELFRSPE